MGQIFSHLNNQLNNNAAEEMEVVNSYKYPPKSGNFFSSTFIMGGERFDQTIPESYLFGENSDLNWLAPKPTAFPYSPPRNSDPTKTLKSFVNIRKESVKFVKSDTGKGYSIEFVFDSDLKCTIRIHYFCSEEVTTNKITYVSRDSALVSEAYSYDKGASQVFSQPAHVFYPNKFTDDEMQYSDKLELYPIVIHCVIDEIIPDSTSMHSHSTICVIDHHTSDGEYHLRAMKQKIFVDGLCYLLQEIYGIENKNLTRITNDDDEDNGSECVICICEPRDTLILPCRHLCLCNSCADSLRYQANNCPICRSPFRALLQIRAVKKSNTPIVNINQPEGSESIPIGYTAVPLIESLNGPFCKRASIHSDSFPINEKDVKVTTPDSVDVPDKIENSESTEFKKKLKDKKSLSQSFSIQEKENSVDFINEKTSANELELDEDSDGEKLSPLLTSNKTKPLTEMNLHKNSTEHVNKEEKSVELKGEDSDYYTPEDPDENQSIISPLQKQTPLVEKKERTPLTLIKDSELPDSPLSSNSQVSSRSGDSSYSSSSSTKQLLSSSSLNVKSTEATKLN